MLIKKFENYTDDDVDLIKYVPEECEKITNFLNLEKQYNTQKSTITKLINEWFAINYEYIKKKNEIKFNRIDNWSVISNINIPFRLEGGFNESSLLDKIDFEDLIRFINDPELYKKAKKYNI